MPQSFYITTPIYYVNDRPHIGHVYTTTIADIIARHQRLMGKDVFFLTGVDEHAAKVVDAAAERGLTPIQWADRNAAIFKETFARLGISNNDFVRTTEERHKRKVQEYFSALQSTGDVYPGEFEGWYDVGQEEYVTENNARESDYKSPINGKPLVRKKEKNYFFRLSQYRQILKDYFAAHPDFVQPEARRNEILNRINEMVDVPISRTGSVGWGIPVPNDPEHVIFVWIDALFNYLSYVDTDNDPSLLQQYGTRRRYWNSGTTHLIAKDILWFHAAYWPALLVALQKIPGYEWVVLPKQVYAHSFWISEGMKMSKTLGNFIDLEKIDHYVQTFSLDALRYFLASNGPLGTTDSDFAESKFIEVYNSDLANKLGNCLSRGSNMSFKNFDGKLPETTAELDEQIAKLYGQNGTVQSKAAQTAAQHVVLLEKLDLGSATFNAMTLISKVDELIELSQPFKLVKDPATKALAGAILYHCLEGVRIASLLLWPVMPGKVEELWQRLGMTHYAAEIAAGRGDFEAWVKWGGLKPGTPISQGTPLFPRYQAAKTGG